tara:strand:- start:3621 stop:4142 length:522 start_codon:yes stop_codon:yes gene_type:complete
MNKIIVSVIIAVILVLGINKIADFVFYVEKPTKSAYQVASVSTTSETTSISSNEESLDIMVLIASANVEDGKKVFKKCAACHSINKGGSNKIGPNLWNILGKQSGSVANYKYSKAMTAHQKSWTFEEMNGFLISPKKWIKGTKMSFIGLSKPEDRAAVILYMNKNTDSPLPIQ